MPSPWVQRALRNELPAVDRTAVYSGENKRRPDISAEQRQAMALRDITEPYVAPALDSDPIDGQGVVRALRAFGIAR